ncbi:MAG: glycosyltransferase family 2 protein [Actinomycetota bacterium]|jgi:glycosyltransferase involved in cell wall biosynthesis
MSDAAVSVVIATRDRPELLRRAVDAVMRQDYPGPVACLVVVDGGPSVELDEPPADAAGARTLETIRNSRTPGLAGARNSGAAAASGTYLAFCDDDDEWLPTKLSAQVAALERAGGDVAVTGVRIAYGDAVNDRLPPARVTRGDLLRSRAAAVHPSTILVRLQAFWDVIGPIDEAIPGSYGEDYEWLLRAAEAGPIVGVREPLVTVRWGGSLFADRWETMIDAIGYLIDKHPELLADDANAARLFGRIAFANAALHRRGDAARWAWRSVRRRPLERRPYLALAVAAGLVRASTIQQRANAAGRGV